jgi:hypothetical protein
MRPELAAADHKPEELIVMTGEAREQPDAAGIVVTMPTRSDGPGTFEPWLDERALARYYGGSRHRCGLPGARLIF